VEGYGEKDSYTFNGGVKVGRIVVCGICGFTFEEGDAESGLQHAAFHDKRGRNLLELPQQVRDLIQYWADQELRAASEDMSPQQHQRVDTARWVLMHMWYNGAGLNRPNRDDAFKQYQADIRKRYPNTRDLKSNFKGVES